MATLRRVPRSEEVVEFRPVAGLESEWAGWSMVNRSRLWDYLGTYPLGCVLCLLLVCIGIGVS